MDPFSGALVDDLRRMNPWWEGTSLPVLPPTRRHLVSQIHRRLKLRLAPAIVVRGPRQIGKTTAQLQVLQDLLESGVPPQNLFRVQTDDLPELAKVSEPILRLVDWYERSVLGRTLNDAAQAGEPTFLFFDEVQNLKDWAPQLKSLVDSSTTQVLVTGSSALRIELGRDSLAGRITTIEAGVLSLTEIASFRGIDLGAPFLADNGLEPLTRPDFWRGLREHGKALSAARDETFRWFSERGAYPLMHQRTDVESPYLADQLRHAKVCLSDHGLRASWLQEIIPLDPAALAAEPHLVTLAGRIAESVTGAALSTISHLDLSHLAGRADQPEIDFVLTIGTKRIPLEVKYQRRLDPLRDTEGLRTFIEKTVNNAPFGILVCQTDTEEIQDPRIVALPLSSLMLLR